MDQKKPPLNRMANPLHLKAICQSIMLLFLSILFPVFGNAQQDGLPWLQTISPEENVNTIQALSSQAEVRVSDGLTYHTHTVFHDAQRAIFQRVYKDRSVVQGIEGKYIWSFDGTSEKEAPELVGNFVLGHQFHAQILFFDKLHPSVDTPETTTFDGQECHVLTSESTGFKFYYKPGDYPPGMEIIREEEKNIIIKFNDWRDVSGIDLPFLILIDDGSRVFQYAYKEVKFNSGSIAKFRAPESVLTEEQKLLRCHRAIMDDHFFGLTSAIKAQESDTITILSAGEIYKYQGKQDDAMIDRIMATRDYTAYDDLVRPEVKISDDGTLGWVIAQVYAEGIRFDENGEPSGPLEFTCSWIELYEKVEGKWKMSGNVSNFKPGLK